jgi:hypothetical protein
MEKRENEEWWKPDPFYVTVMVKVGPVAVGDIAPPAQTDTFTGVDVVL